MTERENVIKAIKRDNPDWIPYRYKAIATLRSRPLKVRPVQGGRDDWGTNWIPTTGIEGSFPDETSFLDIKDVEDYKVPATDWDEVIRDMQTQIREGPRDKLIIGYNELTLFDRAQALLGTYNCLIATILQPRQFEILLDKIIGYQIKLTEALMKAGCDGVRFTDDWGMQKTLFMAPEHWRKYIKPRIKLLYAVVKSYNGFVFQHSCGHIEEIVPDLIEIGCDVLDPIQPAANDIFWLKKEYGSQLAFMGGLDTQTYLSFGTYAEVKQSVKEVLRCMGEGGGYIAAPSHTITVPELNQKAMLQAINEFNGNKALKDYF